MGHLILDNRERSGLGIHIDVMDFSNWNYKLDTSGHNGILSIIIDEYGVNSNNNDIATKIIKTKEDIATYPGNGQSIRLASLFIDHGGGGRTMESCAGGIKEK